MTSIRDSVRIAALERRVAELEQTLDAALKRIEQIEAKRKKAD